MARIPLGVIRFRQMSRLQAWMAVLALMLISAVSWLMCRSHSVPSGVTLAAFRSVRCGMSESEVESILGLPSSRLSTSTRTDAFWEGDQCLICVGFGYRYNKAIGSLEYCAINGFLTTQDGEKYELPNTVCYWEVVVHRTLQWLKQARGK
jgi:hypothetical protein